MKTIERRVYRDRDGNPTLDASAAVSLLHPEGTEIEDAAGIPKEAFKAEDAPEPEPVPSSAKAIESPPEDKAIKGSVNKSRK